MTYRDSRPNVHTAPASELADLADAEIFRLWLIGQNHSGYGTKPRGTNGFNTSRRPKGGKGRKGAKVVGK